MKDVKELRKWLKKRTGSYGCPDGDGLCLKCPFQIAGGNTIGFCAFVFIRENICKRNPSTSKRADQEALKAMQIYWEEHNDTKRR